MSDILFNRPCYSTIDKSSDIIFLASGGRDSTSMILEASKLGIKGTMAWNDTKYNRKSRRVLEELADITGYELVVVEYDGDKKPFSILVDSFNKVPDVLSSIESDRKYNWRNVFTCCHAFKERPMSRYIKSINAEKSTIVLGIKGYDGSYFRRWRLSELRNKNTFHRRHANGILYYYPLRDCSDRDIAASLKEFNMDHIKSSGCVPCPIFCLFPNMRFKDYEAWKRSIDFAVRRGIHANTGDAQEELDKYTTCSGGGIDK